MTKALPDTEPDSITEQAVAAMNAAVEKVIEQHRRDNAPLAIWRDGKVVWLDPFTMQQVHEPDFAYGPTKAP